MKRSLPLLLLLVTILPTLADGADVQGPTCMSRNEARKVWPRAYLYWSGGSRGQRCWSNRRGGRGIIFVPTKVQAAVPPEPLDIPPDAVADMMPWLKVPLIEWRWPR